MEAHPAADARKSLNEHVAEKGGELHAKYGPQIGWSVLQKILLDRSHVRYPCEVAFTAEGLQEGEFAWSQPKGEMPEDGFVIHVHPLFMTQLGMVPHLVLYQLVAVNYGGFATPDDAETFGAAALGLQKDEYYDIITGLADQLAGCGSA